MVKRRLAITASQVAAGLAVLGLVGCSSILGLKDLEGYPDGGLDAGGDGSELPDGATGDDGTTPPGDSAVVGDAPDAHDATSMTDGKVGDGPSAPDAPMLLDAPVDTSPGIDAPVDSPVTGNDGSCGTPNTSQNCGTCGHDCLGGACSGGVCQPFVLATGVTAYDLVAVGTTLYWTDNAASGAVWTCTVSGNTCSPHTLVTGQSYPQHLAYAGGSLYWSDYGSGSTNDGAIMAHPIGGTTKTLASMLWTPQGVASDGTYVGWAQSYSGAPARVQLLQISNSAVTTHLVGTTASPSGVALFGGNVYWAESGSGNVERLQETSLSSAPTPIGSAQTSPLSLSVDANFAYWVDYTSPGGAVWSYALSNGAVAALRTTESYPIRVASDGSSEVYWIDQGSTSSPTGKLVGWNVAGQTATDIESSLFAPGSLAIQPNAVYFGTLGDSALHMMVR